LPVGVSIGRSLDENLSQVLAIGVLMHGLKDDKKLGKLIKLIRFYQLQSS
jgi:hypothetical protein